MYVYDQLLLSDERESSVTGDCHMMGQTQFGCVKHYRAYIVQ